MNGLAVLLCAAALGVEHNWRTTEEGQLEYVLQVEPTFLTSLQQGQAVTSKLPATAKEVHRLCLRIASGDVRKAPQRAPELAIDGPSSTGAGAEMHDVDDETVGP